MPRQGSSETDWAWQALGLRPGASTEEVRAAWRHAARTAHPDAGGDRDTWDRLQAAVAALGALEGSSGGYTHPVGWKAVRRRLTGVWIGPLGSWLRLAGWIIGAAVAGVIVRAALLPATEDPYSAPEVVPTVVGIWVTGLMLCEAAWQWAPRRRRRRRRRR